MLGSHKSFDLSISKALIAFLVAIGLAACGGGGGSNVGSQNDSPPRASAQVVGSSSTVAGTVTARSGSEVLLSGKESDGIDDPILQFTWRQVDSTGINVDLIERTSNSRSFTAPRVAQPTNLQFELTVVDSENKSATDTVTVSILPAPDSNVFLMQDAATDPSVNSYEFVVAVEPGEQTHSAFSLDLETVVDWVDRSGAAQTLVLNRETINGEWPEQVTGIEDVTSAYFNPRYIRALPWIDVDEINKHFEEEDSRDKRLETRDIDKAAIYIRFIFNSFDNNARVVLLFPDDSTREVITTTTGQIDSGKINVDELREKAGLESRSSAAKYYALINAPATLSQWLAQAGFTADPDNQPGVAHTKYTNNFDLGFGRDMYLRVDEECGNVYSFVGNYPSLESTLQNRNKFATVVMEYSPIDGGCSGDKFVKFLNYVPDERSGEEVLVKSMDFDGRGERFVPGVCTVCHGGGPNDLSGVNLEAIAGMDDESRRALADLDTTFMLWDLDSFLYADDDPAITPDRDRISDAERQKYSRSSQEDQFRALNQGTLDTYLDDPERHAASIELVHGWYGSSNCGEATTQVSPKLMPGATFDGGFVQCGWQTEPTLYQQVFARNCRACHTQLGNAARNFDTAAEFLANPELNRTVFDQGTMPLARLTDDRFWAAFDGGSSAASVLAERRNVSPAQSDLPRPSFTASPPIPDAGAEVRLDGSGSAFADSYNWSLEANSECSQLPMLVGANSAFAAFVAGESGCRYTASLSASNAAGSATLSKAVNVADPAPEAVDFVAPLGPYKPGDGVLRIEVLSRIEVVGDGGLQLVLNADGAAFNPNATNNGDGSLNYSVTNPFGVQDEVQYQLRDANGTPAPIPGVITVQIPAVVPGLTADGSPVAVNLSFSVAGAIPLSGFNIFRGDSADELVLLTTIANGSTRNYRDESVAPDQTYFYQVSALSGEFESPRSSVAQVRTVINPLTGVSATALSATSIRISWNPVADAIGYLIQDGNGAAIATVPAAGSFYDDEGLTPATLYRYRVIADFGGGLMTNFVATEATTLAVPQPGNVQLSKNCTTLAQVSMLSVTWDAVPEAESYIVSHDGADQAVAASPTSSTVSGLPTRSPITIGVRAVIDGVNSAAGTDSITTCVSWSGDIYPQLNTVDCSGCHGPGDTPPVIGPNPTTSEMYNLVNGSCFLTDTCTSGMGGAVQGFFDGGGAAWTAEGAFEN